MSNVHVVKTYKENFLSTPIEDVKKILNYFVKKNFIRNLKSFKDS